MKSSWQEEFASRNSIFKKFVSIFSRQKTWAEIEYFDDFWKERINVMTTFIEAGTSVKDLGCGEEHLRTVLPPGCTYIPVDYKKRSVDCLVADFNQKEYPFIKTDIAFISGCLEYVNDYMWFLGTTTNYADTIILSYCSTDFFPEIKERKRNYWVNHLSSTQIKEIFKSQHCELVHLSLFNSNTHIFVFTKCKEQEPT